jgi:DtxR family Mn-dependent transcriptional regulator
MRENLSQSIEDYLKVIYELCSSSGRASTNQIAEALVVSPASVTEMVQKLARADLLIYQRHRGVSLTPQGERVALEVLRHHRLLELFLHQMLGYEWDEVHEEADRLEHVISEEFEERIALALGDPSHDPHGDPIPTRDLRLPESPSLSLFELRPGQTAVVRRVQSGDLMLLRYLDNLGLVPAARLHVLAHSVYDDNLELKVNGQDAPVVLGPRVTRQIYVETL